MGLDLLCRPKLRSSADRDEGLIPSIASCKGCSTVGDNKALVVELIIRFDSVGLNSSGF